MTEAPAGRLEATGLKKSYGLRTVVKDVHLAVQGGEVVGLLGPNGAGPCAGRTAAERPGRAGNRDRTPVHWR